MTGDETTGLDAPIGRRGALAGFVTAAAGVTGMWLFDGTIPGTGSDRSRPEPTYYVDGDSGDDDNDGRSPDEAWETLAPVNERTFEPGDVVGLRAGTEYEGRLDPGGSGAPDEPIIVDAYEEGDKPAIHAGGAAEAVHLDNQEYWELWNLEITNEGESRGADRCGVRVEAADLDGRLSHIHLRNLSIHDVNGLLEKSAEKGGQGILFRNANGARSAFDDVLVEGCHLERVDRNGIIWHSAWAGPDAWFPSTNVRVRNNLLEDVGGDGIVPIGCKAPLVEHNTARECRARTEGAAVAIWPWGCVDALFQFNEASHTRGTVDGQGFDADYNCRGTVFQYNYSHDNEGGFMLVVDAGETGEWNRGNSDVVVRYNVSENDGRRSFHVSGPVENVRIYNNTVYVPAGEEVAAVREHSWHTWPRSVTFRNNVFHVDGTCEYNLHGTTNISFDNNCYAGAGRHSGWPGGESAVVADPRFVDPGSGTAGLDGADGYRLRADSPCLDAGQSIPEAGERDYWGNSLPDGSGDEVTAIGAYAGEGVSSTTASERPHVIPDHEYGREYVLENVHTGQQLAVERKATRAGAEVVQAKPRQNDRENAGADQRWQIEDVDASDRYCLRNANSGHFLTVDGESTADGAEAVQRRWDGGDNQRFGLTAVGEGIYRIEPAHSEKVLTVPDGTERPGETIEQWSRTDADQQHWRIAPVGSGT